VNGKADFEGDRCRTMFADVKVRNNSLVGLGRGRGLPIEDTKDRGIDALASCLATHLRPDGRWCWYL